MTLDARQTHAALAAAPALESLSVSGREALVRAARTRRYGEGEVVLRQGEPTPSFFVVVEGRVKMVRRLEAGRSLILSLFGPGDLFGAVAALGGSLCDAEMVTLEPTVCLEVQREDLFGLFANRPDLIAEVLPALTRHLAECRNCIVELTCFRVQTRFAQIFLKLAASVGHPAPGGGVEIPVPLSRQELADLAGTTIETAIRTLSQWGKDGLVETRDGGFLLPDPARLEELSPG